MANINPKRQKKRLPEAVGSTENAIIVGYVYQECRKCKKKEKIYFVDRIEQFRGKPSPYEIKCDCGGTMRETDGATMLVRPRRIRDGEKYFADVKGKEVGVLTKKISGGTDAV